MAGKIGDGHADAMARLGLAELRNAVSLGAQSAEVQQTPYGVYGSLAPSEIVQGRGQGVTAEEPSHGLDDNAQGQELGRGGIGR